MSFLSQNFAESSLNAGNGGSGSGGNGGHGGSIGSHNTVVTTAGVIINNTSHNYPPLAPSSSSATETSSNLGYHIPSKPMIFFGRDTVVQETVSQVLQHQHIALIGPGGVGKSSISKAVMHDERIVDYLGHHRCFVTYDGVDPSMMTHNTFLSRLANALAINGNPALSSILSTLRSSPTLLVIDNAETFLDAGIDDAGLICDTIADLGGCLSVHLVLTTRSGNLPNLSWFRRDVGGLDARASRAMFSAVYKKDIGDRLDSLFSSLDHHALSISILSHISTQNGYRTTDEIIQAWKQQHTHLLQRGKGKTQNLAVAIELSINAPSLQSAKTAVLHFLQMVAFLPEGIHLDDISGMFPKSTNIQAVANAICLSSLTYRSQDSRRVTMLAPIRMYIMDRYNADLSYKDPVINSVRDYSYQQLSNDPESWGVRESTNTERLLSFDLSSKHVQHNYKARLRTLRGVDDLRGALYHYHPRETSLFPLLKSVSGERPFIQAGGVAIGRRPSKRLILAKAECLIDICWLHYELLQEFINNDMLGTAESLCRNHLPTCNEQLVSCLRLKGICHVRNGNLFLADDALREASTLAHSLNDHFDEAVLSHELSHILFLRGNVSEATSLIASAEEYFRSNNNHVHLRDLLLDQINVLLYKKDFDMARVILDEVETLDREHNGSRRSLELLNWRAKIEGSAGNIPAAIEILNESVKTDVQPDMHEFIQYVEAWRARAFYAAILGHYDDAYIFLTLAAGLASQVGQSKTPDTLLAAYAEMCAGKLDEPKGLLGTALKEDSQDTMQFTGFIYRALGEVALLEGHKDEAGVYFAQVQSMCDTSGMAPRFLYANCYHCYSLPAEYEGWTRYLDGTL